MRQLFVAYQPDDKYEVFDTLSSAFDWAYNMYSNTNCSVYLDLIEAPTRMNVKWEVFFWDFYLRYKDIVIDYDDYENYGIRQNCLVHFTCPEDFSRVEWLFHNCAIRFLQEKDIEWL